MCYTLSNAIGTGDIHTATETTKLMSQEKIQLVIKLKNPKVVTVNGGSDSFKYVIMYSQLYCLTQHVLINWLCDVWLYRTQFNQQVGSFQND